MFEKNLDDDDSGENMVEESSYYDNSINTKDIINLGNEDDINNSLDDSKYLTTIQYKNYLSNIKFEPITYEQQSAKTNTQNNKKQVKKDIPFTIDKPNSYSTYIASIINSIKNHRTEIQVFDNYPYFYDQIKTNFTPELSNPSEIITEKQLKDLHNHLPCYEQYKNFKLEFSISVDGSNIKTFYSKCKGIGSSILLIKDENNYVLGAYSSEEYKYYPNSFYGCGEVFIFSFFNTNKIYCFLSTGENENWIFSDYNSLCFGGSDESFSLSLKNDFLNGFTSTTKTFKNPPLTLNNDFQIMKLELWSFHGKN